MSIKNGDIQVERLPKFCEPILHHEWTPSYDKNYRWPCLCINCRVERDRDPQAWLSRMSLKDIDYWLLEAAKEKKKKREANNYEGKRRGPVPEFPKYKLITFTVNDENENIRVLELKAQVEKCFGKYYVPEWYIGVIEYGEGKGRIHSHVLACFGKTCKVKSELLYSKFNSRFKTRYLKSYKLGNIDIKNVNLSKNPDSIRDISQYFSKDPERYLFFSGIESEKKFCQLVKQSGDGEDSENSEGSA